MDHRISLLALLACAMGCAATTPPEPMVPLPSVELRTLDSRSADLHAFSDGRAAVVNLWASWCEACETRPVLNGWPPISKGFCGVVVGVAVGGAGHGETFLSGTVGLRSAGRRGFPLC
jgi:hypothetical protein